MVTLKKQLQKLLGTSSDISWDIEKEIGTKAIINIQKDFKPARKITDMDIDMAMNDPSRLKVIAPKQTGEKVRMSLQIDDNWNIIKSKILKKRIK